jgi:hypothetical protein
MSIGHSVLCQKQLQDLACCAFGMAKHRQRLHLAPVCSDLWQGDIDLCY